MVSGYNLLRVSMPTINPTLYKINLQARNMTTENNDEIFVAFRRKTNQNCWLIVVAPGQYWHNWISVHNLQAGLKKRIYSTSYMVTSSVIGAKVLGCVLFSSYFVSLYLRPKIFVKG